MKFKPATVFKQALLKKKSGHLQEAEALCLKILDNYPQHPETRQLLGILTLEQNRYEDSIYCFREAIRYKPNAIDCYFYLGRALAKGGYPEDAIACLQHVCDVKPDSAQARFELGRLLKQRGNLDEAIECFRQAISIRPDYTAALNNLGNLLQAQGKTAEAAGCYQEVLRIAPEEAAAHYNLGNIHLINKEIDKAEQCYLEAIRHNQKFADPYFQLGTIQLGKEQFLPALDNFKKALSCNPDHVEANLNLADLYRRQGEIQNVILLLQQVVRLRPDLAMAWNNLGAALQKSGSASQALECYKRAVELDPDLVQVYSNMGQLHQSMGRNKEALAAYEKALKREDPYGTQVFYSELDLRLTLCDWQDHEKRLIELDQRTRAYVNDPELPFELPVYTLGYVDFEPSLFKAVSIKQASLLKKKVGAFKALSLQSENKSTLGNKQKIRIGYISPNFRKHPAGVLVYEAFRHHNRDTFEIYAYSLVNIDDRFSRSVRYDVDVFRDISQLSTIQAAGQIQEDDIDILVTLAGYTTHMRTDILALQPAPVQAHYLGYHQTMGADFIPYTFTDSFMRTVNTADDFTEAIIELPDCVMLNSPIYPSEQLIARRDFSLPEDGFIFASFNFPKKISPSSFRSWMRILRSVPDSVLWIYDADIPEVRSNLRFEAEQSDVDPNRLVFTGKIPIEEHWTRFSLADIFLDTFIYNAHVTAIESLRAGLPVLTCKGETHNARLCSSILVAAHLEEMICNNIQEFEEQAVFLATHPEQMAVIRDKLAHNLNSVPLFDTGKTIGHLEESYKRMWHEHQADHEPKSFTLC